LTISSRKAPFERGESVIRALPEETMMDELQETTVEIDERWLSEWFEFGFSEMGSYLAKHAAFEEYCRREIS
jgi:hypothetical protein